MIYLPVIDWQVFLIFWEHFLLQKEADGVRPWTISIHVLNGTVEPHYNMVLGVHSGDHVIDEACYSEVLAELYFILDPDSANHVCNKMDMSHVFWSFALRITELLQNTLFKYTF